MKYAFFRPTLLAAAVWLSVPMTLSAQTAPASAPAPSTTAPGASGMSATPANPGVPAVAPASEGKRTAEVNTKGNASVAKANRDFMRTAAGAGMYEVEVSRVATERATKPDVKAFAEKMVSDHTAANQELSALAQARGVKLPQEMPKAKRQVIDTLKKSKNFDEDYVKTVGLKDHKADIALFEKAHRSAKDEELKTWTGEKLPTLKSHLVHAQKLHPQGERKIGKTSPGSNAARMPAPASSPASPAPAANSNR